MITSYIPGRVRIRHKALKNAEAMENLTTMVKAQEGVKTVESNARTGSVLVEYDPHVIDDDMLKTALVALEEYVGKEEEPKKASKRSSAQRRLMDPATERTLLNASFAGTLLGILVSPKLHVWAGGAFAVLSVMHIYSRGGFSLPKRLAK